MKIKTIHRTTIADTITPVSLYLNLRDKFENSLLLESSDYHGNQNTKSLLCFKQLASFEVNNGLISIKGLGLDQQKPITNKRKVELELQQFIADVQSEENNSLINGVFGYTAFDAIQYFDTTNFTSIKTDCSIPTMMYSFYKFIIEINHFNDELTIIENLLDGEPSTLSKIESLITQLTVPNYTYKSVGGESSNICEDGFKQMVQKAKEHCRLGDVFQLVLSRQFKQAFKGDEFNVYRALRSVNPSPYLYFFDFGNFKLFGSSPEAQLKIDGNKAVINPIAGTFKRTGDDRQDKEVAQQLADDPKENAEHNMLVDLVRNDLSKHGKHVRVRSFKKVQFYSHVIHLVSEVEAEIDPKDVIRIFADTFPAGTLSGAPKYKALELINQYENQNRGFYGGAIGYFGFDGSVNHAICIRSFMSKQHQLYYQAGAGVVVDSDEESELQEVTNKLGALKQSLIKAEQLL